MFAIPICSYYPNDHVRRASTQCRQGDLECCLLFSEYVWHVPGKYTYIRNTRMAKVKWHLNLSSILKGEHKYLMFVWRGIKIAQLRQHAECIQFHTWKAQAAFKEPSNHSKATHKSLSRESCDIKRVDPNNQVKPKFSLMNSELVLPNHNAWNSY